VERGAAERHPGDYRNDDAMRTVVNCEDWL